MPIKLTEAIDASAGSEEELAPMTDMSRFPRTSPRLVSIRPRIVQ